MNRFDRGTQAIPFWDIRDIRQEGQNPSVGTETKCKAFLLQLPRKSCLARSR
jgi:hypothetical protein